MEFLLELCLQMCQQDDRERKFLAIRIIARIYRDRPFHRDVSQTVHENVLAAIIGVLYTVVEMGVSNLEEMRDGNRQGPLPLGVPAPFNHRQDLNRLLQTHRHSLKRKNMKRDDAVEARKEAYELIPMLPSFALKVQDDNPFRLPTLLLQCAVHEDSYLEHYVIKAIHATLALCVQMVLKSEGNATSDRQASLRHQANSLLPSLLEAICSEVVSARSVGMEWIRKLLVHMDVEAALYLASFLLNDEDRYIADRAREFVSSTKVPPKRTSARQIRIWFRNIGDVEGRQAIWKELSQRVSELTVALDVSDATSQKLLLHTGFSVEKASADFRQDQDRFLKLCGLYSDKMNMSDREAMVCGICYEEMAASERYSLQCGHVFCMPCWLHYLHGLSESKFAFLDARCPHHECDTCLERSNMQEISLALAQRWDESLLGYFVERDPSHRYCPGPDCQNVAISYASPQDGPTRVSCESCQTDFCFHCGETPHAPATCEDFAAWSKLKGSSRLWLKHHSKPCPGCDAPIEKNGGCNHVHCSSCQTDFCWICLALLNRHLEAHTCNRYDPVESAEDDFEKHALFTVTRYEAHDLAQDFAAEQLTGFHPEKLLEAFWFLDEEHGQIFRNGLQVLVHARCFLKHSYVASLGLRNDPGSLERHESHHACLEMFAERLSALLEMNLQRFYLENGEKCMKHHFRRIAFYATSITSYQGRILELRHFDATAAKVE